MAAGIVVAVFPSSNTLTRALDYLIEQDVVTIKRAAVVAKATDGETIIVDDDLSPNEGAMAGGTMGAVMAAVGAVQFGALALSGVDPLIAVVSGIVVGGLAGGVIGHLVAHRLGLGFNSDQLEAISAQLAQGHSALMLELDDVHKVLEQLQRELRAFNAEWIEPLAQALQNPPADLAGA